MAATLVSQIKQCIEEKIRGGGIKDLLFIHLARLEYK